MNSIKEELIKLGFEEVYEEVYPANPHDYRNRFKFAIYYDYYNHGTNIKFMGGNEYMWKFMYKKSSNSFYYWNSATRRIWTLIEEDIDIASMLVLYK